MKELKVRLTFIEPILGTAPGNPDIYADWVGVNAPDPADIEDELEAISGNDDGGGDTPMKKGKTIFPKLGDGTPIFWDYMFKGFFKDTCGGLRKIPDMKSSKIKAYKKEIDKLIFIFPRQIPIRFSGEITELQRPLRAQTAQGDRSSIAISEMIPEGATCELTIRMLLDTHDAVVREWLDYGALSGMGQWRNASYGRFTWEEIK